MTIRIIFTGAAALILSAASASAQGKTTQQVVVSKAVMKSMAASKSKSKMPLTAKVGMIRRPNVAASQAQAPTSVHEARPASKKE
jgi:hypothetical protein